MLRKLLPVAFCLAILFAPGMAIAQNATISGKVVDADGEALIGASVLIQELVIGAATNLDGDYTFEVPAGQVNGQAVTLKAQFVGYTEESRTITLSPGAQTQNFVLRLDLLRLDEVVVTGVTDATPQKKLAFDVDKLDASAIELAPAANPVSSLQGKIAGASVVSNSGAPGESSSVRLRGTTSLSGSSAPLYIVDGVILGSDQVDIGALDIESMEVVKGAAASSLYGSRAQNGVINITTKRGTDVPLNQTRVTVRNEIGLNSLPNDIQANTAHNLRMNAGQTQFVDADGNLNACDTCFANGYGPGTLVDTNDSGASFYLNPYPGQQFDAFDEFFDPGNTFSNFISVSQNSAKTNFFASFTNYDEAGIIAGLDGYNRKSFRLNLDHRVNQDLFVSASSFYSQSTNDTPNASINADNTFFNPFFGLMFTSPLSNLGQRDENGQLSVQADPLAVEENPLYVIENTELFNNRSRILGNFRVRYSPLDWVDLEGNLSYDRSDRDSRQFQDRGFQSIDPSSVNDGRIERRNAVQEALNGDFTASMRRTFGDMTTRMQLKYQVEQDDFYSEGIIATNLIAAGIPDLSNIQTGEGDNRTVFSTETAVRSEGYYATLDADYADKYIGSFLIRRDGSSLFGEDERWHNYFRFSGAYRVSEELWWPLQTAIPEFKLRYSYGTAGARPTFSAQYETFNVGAAGITKGTLGNSFLKPELQTEQEFGLEMALGERFLAELVYAVSDVEDQLLLVPLAGYFGFSNQWQNAGSLESNTIEAQLSGNLMRTRDMSWDFGFTFDRTRQEITEFNSNPFRNGPQSIFYVRDGEVIGSMYGNLWITEASELPAELAGSADAFDVNDDGYLVPVGAGNTYQSGAGADGQIGTADDLWGTTVDVNGESLRWGIPVKFFDEDEQTDFVQIGDAIPDFNLGFNTTFTFKGITAYMLWNAQVGGDVYNFTKQWSYRDGRAQDQDQTGKAVGDVKSAAYYEVLYDATAKNTHFVEDATYLKLRELSLGYTFNRQQLASIFGNALHRVNIRLIGRNLLTFTDYTGFDPEVGDGNDASLFRVDNFAYPNYRTLTGVLEIQF